VEQTSAERILAGRISAGRTFTRQKCGAGFLVSLHGADLHDANLNGMDLRGANLSGADLSGADISGTDFGGANLSGTKGLPAEVADLYKGDGG